MLVAFCWLTIGTSFVSLQQQKQTTDKTDSKGDANENEKNAAPFENAKEEKTETSSNTFSEEYLGEDTEHFACTDTPLKHTKCHTADAFIAYYGESASQPPEAITC